MQRYRLWITHALSTDEQITRLLVGLRLWALLGLVALVSCTPYGVEPLAVGPAQVEEEEQVFEQAEPGELEPIYGEYDDREEPVEVVEEDPRCWRGTQPGEALEISGADAAAPETGIMKVQHEGKLLALPLQHTSFNTVVVGTVAETEVVQTFANPFDHPIEAVYVFPLHERAAVDDYWLTIGERSIRGQIQTRKQARRSYEAAKQAGRAAALLEQERPNIFTQSVANIPPGAAIEVSIHLVQPLEQQGGKYSLVLPTVVGQRFIPGRAQLPPASGHGVHPDTDVVPDASRITPPIVPSGYVTCADLDVSVTLEPGLRPRGLRSKFHAIDIERRGDLAFVKLDANSEGAPVVANRDFILSWDLGTNQPQAVIVAQPDDHGKGGYFTLTLMPPEQVADVETLPRELVFVIDNSGSMDGKPILTANTLVQEALAGMRSDDTFTILRFSDTVSSLSDTLLPATPDNVARGESYIQYSYPLGGTMMGAGIEAALGLPRDPDRLRVIMLLTDGYIGDEADIFELVERDRGGARLFALGVGDAPNRYLLDGLARVGRGAVDYAAIDEDIDEAVARFYEKIETPLLRELEIDWQGLKVSEVLPGQLPDLFAGQPLTVLGRYRGKPDDSIIVRGQCRGGLFEIPVRFDIAAAQEHEGIASMWARAKIDELTSYPRRPTPAAPLSSKAKKRITALAIEYGIVTELTSFVAVENTQVVDAKGELRTIVQPVQVIEGAVPAKPEPVVIGGHAGGVAGAGVVGLGTTGLIGKGGSGGSVGYAAGSGAGFGGRGKPMPIVRQGPLTVTPGLDEQLVRRIIRGHASELHRCYSSTMAGNPRAEGELTITFVINAAGNVSSAQVRDNHTGDSKLGACMSKAAKGWKFSPPQGGSTVTVTQTFELSVG